MAKTPKKSAGPKIYVSDTPVYVDGVLYGAGEKFVTDKPVGSTWTEIDAQGAAVLDAQKAIKGDFGVDGADHDTLKARAASLGLNLPDGSSDDDIRAIIRAHDDPTL